ncbi:MAG TPA: lytic transglycosylase domain-containing protein [Thermoanaerobaculia bacterium]
MKRLAGGWWVVAGVLFVSQLQAQTPASTPAAKPAATQVNAEEPAATPSEAQLAATERRALAKQALAKFTAKQWDEAIPALEAAAAKSPAAAPFLRLRIVQAEESRGNLTNAAAVAAQLAATGTTSASTTARLKLPGIYAELGDRERTDGSFAQLASLTIDELNERDFLDLSARLTKAARNELAKTLRMRLLTDYTAGRWTERVYSELSPELDKLSLDASVELASKLARVNRYDQALDMLERIARRFPDAQTKDLYRSVRIRALFNSRNYAQLVAETENVKLNDPALMMTRARAAWRNDQPQVFLAGLTEVEKQFPNSKEAAEAKIIRAKYYTTDSVNHALAVQNLEAGIAAGAAGNDGENLWNVGWTHTLAGELDKALSAYARYIREYPDGDWKTNSLFWSAKIHDRRGETELRDARAKQIVAEYPTSYYAYRVRELWKVNAPLADPRPFPNLDAEVAKVNDRRLATVRELEAIGLAADATREMKLVAAAYPDNLGIQFMLADLFVRGNEPFRANGVLQRRFRQFVRHGGTNIPQRFWEILYPLPSNYWETIRAEAARRSLDPYLVASIIRQESGFEPTTVSNAGAVGLMQIMPQEAERIATAGGLSAVSREQLFEPLTNIAVGVAEFQQKLQRMSGNQTHAIAAYNAGETAVDQWIARMQGADADMFIEAIPYAETRLYVKTVTRNRFEYRRIYERPAAAAAGK